MSEPQAGPPTLGGSGELRRGMLGRARGGGDGGCGSPRWPGAAPLCPGYPGSTASTASAQTRAETSLCNSSAAGAVTRKVVATETKPPQTPLSLTGKDGAGSTLAVPGVGLRQPGGGSSSSQLSPCLAPFVVLSCYRAQVG